MEKANSNSGSKGEQETECERERSALRSQLKALNVACPNLARTSFVVGGLLGLTTGTALGMWIGGRQRQ